MKKIKINRWAASVLFLSLMAVNFAVEGFTLFFMHGGILLPQAKAAAVCSAPGAGSSCCKAEAKPVNKCGCPCCGENCPMGDACTCNESGKSKSRGDGLFFQMPTCHPEQAGHDSSYLPLSMRLVFLAPAAAWDVALVCLHSMPPPIYRQDHILAPPPVPPPRPSAA